MSTWNRRVVAALLVAGLVAAGGCAAGRESRRGSAAVGSDAAGAVGGAAGARSGPSELTLEQLLADLPPVAPPEPPAGAAGPATQPTTRPSLAAIELYARARGAMQERQFYTAVNLLERCEQLDPESAEVQFALGRAYLQIGGATEKAAAALDRATRLDPDSLDAWLELARLRLRGAPAEALEPLLRATRTEDYATDDGEAAIVDLFLARALQQRGYDRAAVAQYQALLERLSRRSLAIRGNPDVAALAARPEPIVLELARLYERRGEPQRAIALYDRLAGASPESFEPQARAVRALLSAGRGDAATRRAGDVVRRFRASPPSIELFLDAHRRAAKAPADGESRAVSELTRMYRADPSDDALLTALADVLAELGRDTEARKLLADAVRRAPGDIPLLRRLVRLMYERGDALSAAQVLIEDTARRPHAAAADVAPLWRPLVEPWRPGAIRPDDLRRIELSKDLEPVRQYWIARLASEARRPALVEAALRSSVETSVARAGGGAGEPFAPAFLLRIQHLWQDDARTVEQRREAADALLAATRALADPGLTAAVEAADAFYRLPSPEDLPAFERAVAAHGRDGLPPTLALLRAESFRRAGQADEFEQSMWKLLEDHPLYEDAYIGLYAHYVRQSAAGQAMKVLDTWSSADPRTLAGRTIYVDLMLDARQYPLAEAALEDLLREHADETEVLGLYLRLHALTSRPQQAIDELARMLGRDPTNGALVQALVAAHRERGETPAALQVLAASTEAAAGQPNLLYQLSHLYFLLGERAECERTLERALAVDPQHVPASNDLAYFWAEAGRNLVQAEAMARLATAAEPDNAAYLDTLGWVLYKQGRFAAARDSLRRAAEAARPPDATVLDHLGDAAYRLGDVADAVASWQKAVTILRSGGEADRPDDAALRLRLDAKLRQRLAGEEVDVAPVAAGPPPDGQTRSN